MEEDDERREFLDKIVGLLLEAGYFRARISSLSPFDKLTGGLAWCITASNADIDFDVLFYDDDATLGDKIGEHPSPIKMVGCCLQYTTTWPDITALGGSMAPLWVSRRPLLVKIEPWWGLQRCPAFTYPGRLSWLR